MAISAGARACRLRRHTLYEGGHCITPIDFLPNHNLYSYPPKASYCVASPRRTTAYCLRRRALSETFGGWLYDNPTKSDGVLKCMLTTSKAAKTSVANIPPVRPLPRRVHQHPQRGRVGEGVASVTLPPMQFNHPLRQHTFQDTAQNLKPAELLSAVPILPLPHRGGDSLAAKYSHPPKASYCVASPRRTKAYCIRRRALSETFGGWLYTFAWFGKRFNKKRPLARPFRDCFCGRRKLQ